jgi:hypothetical protein
MLVYTSQPSLTTMWAMLLLLLLLGNWWLLCIREDGW